MKENINYVENNNILYKAAKSIISLGIRQIIVQIANILGGVLLARFLTTKQYGTYSIVTFLMNFLITFGGTGLAANLIRQEEEPNAKDYKAIFTFQQIIVLIIVIVFWLSSSTIAKIYNLDSNNVWVFRFVGLSIFFTSFMVIPQVKLERELSFDKLAIVEISQAISFNFCAVFFAIMKFGAMSFALALLIRAIVGAVLANVVEPWKIGVELDIKRVKKQLKFGLYYQGTQLISVIKDSITPTLIGLSLGVIQVGYVNWANTVACYSLLILMIFQRVYMPVFAKLQMFPEKLSEFVDNTIWLSNGIVAIFAVLTLIFIKPIISFVFGSKWTGAINIFYLFWIANLFVPTSTVIGGLVNAIGEARINTVFSLVNMGLTWIFGTLLINKYGVVGFGIAAIIVQMSNIIFFKISKKYVKYNIVQNSFPIWIISIIVGGIFLIIEILFPIKNIYTLFIYIILGIILYGLIIFKVWNRRFKSIFKLIKSREN